LSRPADVPGRVLSTMVSVDPSWVTIIGGENALSAQVEATLEETFNSAGERYEGIGVGEAVGPAPLIDSEDYPADGRTAADARLCLPGSLDEDAIDGEIVICTRGTNARVEKSDVVAAAGGIGMIMANNNDSESLNA